MKEKQIEQKFVRMVKALGGLALKMSPIGMDGIPDRIVLMPGGKAFFVEVKAPGKQPRALQKHRMEQLQQLGFSCFVLDKEEKIEEVLKNGIHSA